MAFSLNTRKIDNVVIVDLAGQLIFGESVLLLRDTVRRFVEDGTREFVLNLGDVSYIDSSGLGGLIGIHKSVKDEQGDVNLLSLTKRSRGLLQTTKLLTVFDTFDDETQAVRALTGRALTVEHSNR